MSFPRYPEYKDSGVEWLGEVPAHWETWKVAHAFGLIGSGTTPPSSEEHWYDSVGTPWVTTGELRENIIFETSKSVTDAALEKFSALRIHPAGSLVVAMYGATIGRLGILGVDAVTNQACCVLSYPRHLDIAFTYYWLQGFKQIIIDLFSTGGGQPNINQDTVASLRIPAPGLPEQTAIATFLDRETAKIDALVAEQEKLIALLQEKRQAVISHAVTKGLDPNVPMKDSGVEWLGEIPAHWEVLRIKQLTAFAGGGTPSRDVPEYWHGELPWVSPKDMKTEFIVDSEERITDDGLRSSATSLIPIGAVLMVVRSGILKHTIPVAINQQPVALNQDMKALRFDSSRIAALYFLRFVQGLNDTLLLEWSKQGATVESIEHEYLANSFFPVPPILEQTTIANFLDQEIAKLNALMTEAQSAITLLQERRTALISAAVTGQIDVRGLVGGVNAPDSVAASAYPASA